MTQLHEWLSSIDKRIGGVNRRLEHTARHTVPSAGLTNSDRLGRIELLWSMPQHGELIELQRQFTPPSSGPTGLDVAVDHYIKSELKNGISWEELLKKRIVVVLGEAWAGKSSEFKLRERKLKSEGKPAFRMEIRDLAQHTHVVDKQQQEKLKAWQAGELDGFFFLDSVDEAQINGYKLTVALTVLKNILGEDNARAHILISCRASDWSSASEYDIISHFGKPEILQLLPLNTHQIESLARFHNCRQPQQFVESVKNTGARPLISRPVDVEWAVHYWNEKNTTKLGTWAELLDKSLSRRINERRPQSCPPSNLDDDKAYRGLMRIAGLATLSGRRSLLIPTEEPSDKAKSDIIDVDTALKGDEGWSKSEIRELLTRAVFDESTYQSVRFYQRDIQEYLAAKWIDILIKKHGLTRRQTRRLLVKELGGIPFIPAHLLPTAGWLAHSNDNVLELLIRLNPGALFKHGDPAGYSLSTRKRALKAYMKRYNDCDILFDEIDNIVLRRFAPGLGETVKEMFRKVLPPDATLFLLRLVAYGELSPCISDAESWALDTSAQARIRCMALRAVKAIGTSLQKRNLITQVLNGHIDEDIASFLISRFFPSILTINEIGLILRTTVTDTSEHSRLKVVSWRGLPRLCPPSARLSMIIDLIDVIPEKKWLRRGIQELLRLVIDATGVEDEPSDALQSTIRKLLLGHQSVPLRSSISIRPRIKRYMFWEHVRSQTERTGGIWPNKPGYCSWLAENDATWLAQDALSQTHEQARHIAFQALLQLQMSCGIVVQDTLEILVQSSNDLTFSEDYAEYTQKRQAAILKNQEYEQSRAYEERERRRKELEVYHSELDRIRSGEHRDFLRAWAQGNGVARLRENFGDEIAEAAIEGYKRSWRNFHPDYNTDDWLNHESVAIGLVGLDLEFAEGLNAKEMTGHEVDVATRYAIRSEHTCPRWFKEIADEHPHKVCETLRPAIEAELRFPIARIKSQFRVLHRPIPRTGCVFILENLRALLPVNKCSLKYALRHCASLDGNERKLFVELCTTQFEKAESVEEGVLWWCALASGDPLAAVCYLEEFAETALQKDLDEVVQATCVALHEQSAVERFKEDDLLERFFPIVFRSIRLADDEKYDPFGKTPRSKAQDVRLQLLNWLSTGKAVRQLHKFAEETAPLRRDLVLAYARRCLQNSLHAKPMAIAEALEWSQYHAAQIRSVGDLNRVTLDRLDDIREECERGEFFPRELFHTHDEPVFQKYIALRLKQSQKIHHYTISREEEADREKEPDIRVSHSACAGHPISIEIKIADKKINTVQELTRVLRFQLVDLYLRQQKSRHGILILCSRPEYTYDKKKQKDERKRKKWRFDNSKILSFSDVVRHIQDEARKLVLVHPGVDALNVLGIDFH